MINNSLLSAKKISAIYFTIDGNMTTQANTKTGDVMSWFVEGVPYSGNNTPTHTFLNVGGEGMIKSSDRFNGLATLNFNGCNLTSLDIGSLAGIRFPASFQIISNKIVNVTIPESDNVITNFYTYFNPELLSLDLSGLTGLGGIIGLHTCTKLTTLTLPVSSQIITTFYAHSNPELLSLDLSGLAGLGGDIRLYFCAKLATLTLPVSSQIITTFYAHSNPELLSLDLSGLTGLGGDIRLYSCGKLTTLTLPVSSKTITFFWVYSNPELTSLDLSGLTGLGGDIRLYSCGKLASIILPITTENVNILQLYYNTLLSGVVDLRPLRNLGGIIDLNSSASPIANRNITNVLFYPNIRAITRLTLSSLGITGNLDLSMLGGLGGNIQLQDNPNMTDVSLPTSTQIITTFYAHSNPELLSLDLSGLTGLGGDIRLYSCGKLASIVLPITTENVNNLQLYYNTLLSGVVDLRPLRNLGGIIDLNSSASPIANRNITNVLFYPNSRAITRFTLSSLGITGNLDLSMLGGLGGNVQLQNNPNMTGISLPTSTQIITTFHAHSNPELLSLDLSNLTGLGGSINLTSCAKLTTLTLPASSQTITFFWANNNPELTSLNLSGLTGLGGSIDLSLCAKLATLILPISNKIITSFLCYGSIVTTFNLSTLTGFGGDFRLQHETAIVINNTVTSLTLPTNANSCAKFYINSLPNIGYVDFKPMPNILNKINSTLRMRDNNWSAAIVNQVLHELNIGTTSGFTGRSISIGGTNADPDATSGGYDGLTAKANLEAKGITVNIV